MFEVKKDERIPLVRAALPGANCGGCGYPGCDALAEAIVKGDAPANACPVGGPSTAVEVGEIMGESVGNTDPQIACVHCNGDCEHAPTRADYYGIKNCREAMIASGGPKECRLAVFEGFVCGSPVNLNTRQWETRPAHRRPRCLYGLWKVYCGLPEKPD